MKKHPLLLEHQAILQPRFQSMALCLSEYSFASRFLFRREHDLHVLFDDQEIWLQGTTRDKLNYLMPTQTLSHIPSRSLLKKLEEADCFYPIPESWLPLFPSSSFRSAYTQDDSDYLYQREKIAEYAGRNLSPKRNLVKQFLELYTARIVPYTQEHLNDALFVLDAWQKGFANQKTDYLACQDGLKLADKLGLHGYLIYVGQDPAALILGEPFPPHLFVIHFAKGLVHYKGIYPFLFKELATHLPYPHISWLNFEQDLGQDGLRQSKLSYQPDKLAHKYRIFPSI